MINSHKEFISEMKNFAEKMDLIKEFVYIKDIDNISNELSNSEPRVFIVGIESVSFDDKEYNSTITYKFVLSDSVLYDEEAIINSETENIFIVSSLKDYLCYIQDVDVDVNDIDFTTESEGESTYTSVSGKFDVLIKIFFFANKKCNFLSFAN